MKPVFMINGFLESGKTEFITYTLTQPYFQTKGTTLLILCEEGEREYTPELLASSHTVVEKIEEEADFTPATLINLEKKHKPGRIVIEYNGMWNFKNVKYPWHWKLEQQITIIDGSTFVQYYTNMRSLLAEMIRNSEMIVFNRCDNVKDLNSYKRNVKAVNPKAEIIFEDANGEITQIMEEDLPYDIHQDQITITEDSFGIWYLDVMDQPARYLGKQIQFVGMVTKPASFPKQFFVPGRMAMTCCADDMAFLGYACHYQAADALTNGEWVEVTANIQMEYFEPYQGEGPLLYAKRIRKTTPPKEEVIRFV
ncbi:MAG: GTPase [Lachnospiraceae bacterium]|jgi:uncharacterized repeat protein (TIGR03943 family)|nr:GTPase [Lachnospiraceae bacterium]